MDLWVLGVKTMNNYLIYSLHYTVKKMNSLTYVIIRKALSFFLLFISKVKTCATCIITVLIGTFYGTKKVFILTVYHLIKCSYNRPPVQPRKLSQYFNWISLFFYYNFNSLFSYNKSPANNPRLVKWELLMKLYKYDKHNVYLAWIRSLSCLHKETTE